MKIKNRIKNLINPPDYPPLWDKRFTIFTAGTAVSVLGNNIANFLIGLLVLDLSESIFLYSMYLVTFSVTSFIGPIFAGVFLDKFSRVKTIYLLDFFSVGLYVLLSVLLFLHDLSYVALFSICVLIGLIDSVYAVSYQSLMPMLIDGKNGVRAESIISTIDTLGLAMIPVATFLYNILDMWILFFSCGIIFGIAACFETRIRVDETQMEGEERGYTLKSYFQSMGSGFRYLKNDKGLLLLTICGVLCTMALSADDTLMLPFFRSRYENGEYLYFIVMTFNAVGSFCAGIFGYVKSVDVKKRFFLLGAAYLIVPLISGTYMFTPLVVMCVITLIHGFFDELGINVGTVARNNYIPNDYRGRYYGFSEMMASLGGLIGEFMAGILSRHYVEPVILFMLCGASFVVIFFIFVFGKKDIQKLFQHD